MERDKCLYFKEGYKYWVNRPYHIKLDVIPFAPICLSFKTIDVKGNEVEIPIATMDMQGNTIIYPSFCWDGASGPTIDTLTSMICSLIHDLGYQLIRLGLIDPKYKSYFDDLLRDIGKEDGMYGWRTDIWHFAVSEFGDDSCQPSAEHLELVAP